MYRYAVRPPHDDSAGNRPTLGGYKVRAEADAGHVFVRRHVHRVQHNLVLDGPRRRESDLRSHGLGGKRRERCWLLLGDSVHSGANIGVDSLLCLQVRGRSRFGVIWGGVFIIVYLAV